MAYTPPTNPNVDLVFVTTPYTPATNPNVDINFGPESGGGTPNTTISYDPHQAAFFMLFFP